MKKIIACEVVLDAMRALLPADVKTETLPMSLHVDPQALRRRLQERIDASDGVYDPIVLGFGLCSQATVGLRAIHSRLVIARTDDCIGIFLGSRDAYRQQLKQEPGTYFLNRGWVGTKNCTPFDEYETARERWGKERAKRLLRAMLQHYRRLVYVNSVGENKNSDHQKYARKIADKFELRYEELDGKTALINKLIHGPWDDHCVVVPPGETVTLDKFVAARQ